MAMKVYISGPITGMPNKNKEAFSFMEIVLTNAGFNPVNPHKVTSDLHESLDWTDYMREDIKALMQCDAIAFLPGWNNSKGSRFELHTALELGIPILILPGVYL